MSCIGREAKLHRYLCATVAAPSLAEGLGELYWERSKIVTELPLWCPVLWRAWVNIGVRVAQVLTEPFKLSVRCKHALPAQPATASMQTLAATHANSTPTDPAEQPALDRLYFIVARPAAAVSPFNPPAAAPTQPAIAPSPFKPPLALPQIAVAPSPSKPPPELAASGAAAGGSAGHALPDGLPASPPSLSRDHPARVRHCMPRGLLAVLTCMWLLPAQQCQPRPQRQQQPTCLLTLPHTHPSSLLPEQGMLGSASSAGGSSITSSGGSSVRTLSRFGLQPPAALASIQLGPKLGRCARCVWLRLGAPKQSLEVALTLCWACLEGALALCVALSLCLRGCAELVPCWACAGGGTAAPFWFALRRH